LKIRRENFSISPFPSTEEIQNLIKESEEIPANGLLSIFLSFFFVFFFCFLK